MVFKAIKKKKKAIVEAFLFCFLKVTCYMVVQLAKTGLISNTDYYRPVNGEWNFKTG